MQVYGQGGGKKWRRVNVHCTSVFSLLFAVLRQAVKYSVASAYGGPGCVMSCGLD